MELKLLVRFLFVLVLIWSANNISADIVGYSISKRHFFMQVLLLQV